MTVDLKSLVERLPERRWYGHKGRALIEIASIDEAIVEDGPPALVIVLAELRFAEGAPELYQLPLLVSEDGSVADACDDVERLRVFGDLMAHSSSIKGSNGGVFQFGGPGLDPLAAAPGERSVRTVDAEQSNSSIVLDESVILKLFRRLAVGPNPDLELNRLLTNEGFEHVPAQVGEAAYEGEIGGTEASVDLGVAQRFVDDGIEGWQEALARLNGLYDEVDDADAAEDRALLTAERTGELLRAIEQLGDATASLHVVLSREEIEHDLLPEIVGNHDLAAWADRVTSSAGRLASSTDALAPLADAIAERAASLGAIEDAGLKTRVHGDYHLGQVLLTPRGWMMLDFEGEPARSLAERRAKQSPLRDVAGMLRSFDYAAAAALMERAEPGSAAWARLEPWADTWEELARDRFLSGYLTRAHEGRFLPAERRDLATMIEVFEIDKVLYEIGYELSHRPDWVAIPMRGLTRILDRSAP